MRNSMRHQQLRDWWEFQTLYRHLAGLPSTPHPIFDPSSNNTSTNTSASNSSSSDRSPSHKLSSDISYPNPDNHNQHSCQHSQQHSCQHCSQQSETNTQSYFLLDETQKILTSSTLAQKTKKHYANISKKITATIEKTTLKSSFQHAKTKHYQSKMYASRQNQNKRQREWIYLSHYLAISGLNPIYVISGSDDGREPDFTLVFYHDYRLYYVGVELTTLPRLRDRMGDEKLIAKRWYWQSLHQMARLREKEREGHSTENLIQSYDRFRLPLQTLNMPKEEFASMPSTLSIITQQDIDEVMGKKARKVDAYHTRRPLQELWLLVHTDKYQPECILTAPDYQLIHESGFDQIHITRYPSHKVINVNKSI